MICMKITKCKKYWPQIWANEASHLGISTLFWGPISQLPSRAWLCNPMNCSPLVSSVLSLWSPTWDFPGQNTGVGCHLLLQGIFPIKPASPTLAGRLFTTEPPGKGLVMFCFSIRMQVYGHSFYYFLSTEIHFIYLFECIFWMHSKKFSRVGYEQCK